MIKITTLYHKYIEKKKKVIYLILKKKPFQKEIIDQLESQLEFKMNEFFDKIIDKIKETNFNNTEQSLKYILLKGLVLILEKELNKNKIDLSEGEKNTLKEIMENDDIPLFDEKEKEDINNEDNVEKVT